MSIKSDDIKDVLRLTIYRKRKELMLTEYDLSRKTNVDPRTIINFENCSGEMTAESLARILTVLDIESWQFDIYKRFSSIEDFLDYIKKHDTNLHEHSNIAKELNVSCGYLDYLYSKAIKERSERNGDCGNNAGVA